VTERRTKADGAQQIKDVVDVHYPEAERIVFVMDNLNTHSSASLYEGVPPEEATRPAAKLEIHHIPKLDSWLNIAEIEQSVLRRQGLSCRLSDAATLKAEVRALSERRNAERRPLDWRFTTNDARIRLRWLYPALPE
jgi:hypothetical protein